MSLRKKTMPIYSAIVVCCVVIAAVLMYARLFIGAGISDEGIYLSEPYLVLNGMVPYVNGWLNASGFALLKAPATALYLALTGSTEGLLLFQRGTFLLAKVVLCVAAWFLLRKTVGKWDVILFLLPFFVVTQTIVNTGYNDFALWFTFLSGVLLVASFAKNKAGRKEMLFGALAGMSLAAGAFAYPTLIILCAAVWVIVFFVELRLQAKHVRSICFLGGGFLAAGGGVVYLLAAGGGLTNLRFGLETMLRQNVYFDLYKTNPVMLMMKQLGQILLDSWVFPCAVAVCYFLYLLVLHLRNKTPLRTLWRKSQKQLWLVALLGGYVCFALYQIYSLYEWQNYNHYAVLLIAFLLVPIVRLFMQKKVCVRQLFFFIWLPSGLLTVIVGMNLYGIAHRLFFLVAGAALLPLFAKYAIQDTFQTRLMASAGNAVSAAISLLLTGFLLTHNFLAIYGETSPISQLDTRIASGVCAGIYTTKERSQGLELFEGCVRANTTEEDTVLFLDIIPMAYTMTDAKPWTFSSGDVLAFGAGLDTSYLLHRYRELEGAYPTKIIYGQVFRANMSIDEPGYAFNEFVKEHYELSYENRKDGYPILVYTIKEGYRTAPA